MTRRRPARAARLQVAHVLTVAKKIFGPVTLVAVLPRRPATVKRARP